MKGMGAATGKRNLQSRCMPCFEPTVVASRRLCVAVATRIASRSQQMSQFLSKHTEKCQLDRLIAELVCALNVSQPDASNEALHELCADLVYKNNLELAPQDFVTSIRL